MDCIYPSSHHHITNVAANVHFQSVTSAVGVRVDVQCCIIFVTLKLMFTNVTKFRVLRIVSNVQLDCVVCVKTKVHVLIVCCLVANVRIMYYCVVIMYVMVHLQVRYCMNLRYYN